MTSPRHSARFTPFWLAALMVLVAALWAGAASAQTAQTPAPPAPGDATCASVEDPTSPLPPAGSPPLYRCAQLQFHPIDQSFVDATTYLHYLKTERTSRTQQKWVPFDEQAILGDFDNLWRLGYLDNLWIEVRDEAYPNGVMGKHVIFHMEERARIKIVDYVSANPDTKLRVAVSKIEETLRDRNINVRLDSFVDDATIRRVIGVIRELHSDEGYMYSTVEPLKRELAGQNKLLHLTFSIDGGPKAQIAEIVFDGNEAYSDGKLRGQLKDNKPKSWLSFITSAGTYHEAKWADDAQKVEEFYWNKGHARARVGQPQIEVVRDSDDGKKRWIRLVVPVDEGPRYRVGEFKITGTETVKPEFLRTLFKIKEGDVYSRKRLDKGIEKAQEAYGSAGFYQMVPIPEFNFRDVDMDTGQPKPGDIPPVMDIDMKFEEGTQFFINRITFHGNTTTLDQVVRRELRIAEGGVFNTLGLKESIRRLNQLGYFKPLEDTNAIKVTETPGQTGRVDLNLTFEEQNRNQLSFGAGVSQFDGFFGQLAFQTSNFLGRGETVGISLQKGSQARNYQVSFSEPYLFDRPITAGIDLFKRQFIFPLQYTQSSSGSNLVVGFPLADYTRMFMGYSYEQVAIKDINPLYLLDEVLDSSPFLRDSLLIDTGGRRTVSKISPSVVFNTVNQPIFPTAGSRMTASFDIAGIGGNTSFVQSRLEGIFYIPFTNRLSLGLRGEVQYIRPYGGTKTLPIFERFFLGGEYSVRGFDIRTIGPRDPSGRIVIGGNKTALLNAEFNIAIAGPVRLLAFYDAGQVRDLGQKFGWWEDVIQQIPPALPVLYDPLTNQTLREAGTPIPTSESRVIGRRNAFKTSTGIELRFFMPVLNVPFRLISAYNPQRGGVLNNSLLPQPKFTFRFAVGTTF